MISQERKRAVLPNKLAGARTKTPFWWLLHRTSISKFKNGCKICRMLRRSRFLFLPHNILNNAEIPPKIWNIKVNYNGTVKGVFKTSTTPPPPSSRAKKLISSIRKSLGSIVLQILRRSTIWTPHTDKNLKVTAYKNLHLTVLSK